MNTPKVTMKTQSYSHYLFQKWLEDCPVQYYQCDINPNVFEFNLPELNDPEKVSIK